MCPELKVIVIEVFKSDELHNVNGMFFIISKGLAGNLWYCAGHRMSDSKEVIKFEDKQTQNAMCKMLIHLIKEWLIFKK